MTGRNCSIIGAPVGAGAGQPGCKMGPEAYRTAGLAETITGLGWSVEDRGDVKPVELQPIAHSFTAKNLTEVIGWTMALEAAAHDALAEDRFAIFAGGDHSLSLGTVSGAARCAKERGVPFFVLWLDAHPDFHRLDTTSSGNLHGTPVAYFTGQDSFGAYFPKLAAPVRLDSICMMGIRSVDPAEHKFLLEQGVTVYDMRHIDEHGVIRPLTEFLQRVEARNGMLHVSLDVDFLDPAIAPAVGTTVPGGATFREAHLIMEIVCESKLAVSLDLVELNPFLDERGRTAQLMVDLTASLMGRKILDRPTMSL